MNRSHRSTLALAVLLLGACAGRAPREPLPPLATAPAIHQAQREARGGAKGILVNLEQIRLLQPLMQRGFERCACRFRG